MSQFAQLYSWLSHAPGTEQSVERTQQEVAGAAGGIDQGRTGKAEGLDGRREGAVEDELLDEVGRLEQGVGVLGVLGQVLVEIAEESRRPRRIGEIVD